ncbi:MAG: hypothetical protein JSV77_10880 [Dehalococcoidales bacterium]|nr:MAG: hypothetical protein JSV77_10880 [Dehalococcoidales bacterium]
MWVTDEDYNAAVQKAFEQGLEQGYWVGRLIDGAIEREKSEDTTPQTAISQKYLQQIIDITKDKGIEYE